MLNARQYRLEDLSLGMKVNPLSLQDIYGTVIVIGDFDDEGFWYYKIYRRTRY